MKEPKTFNRPRVYFQATDRVYTSRLRIIYPNGDAEWVMNSNGMLPDTKVYSPCWAEQYGFNKDEYGHNSSGKRAVRLMHRFDKYNGWCKAIFIGEL